MLYLYDEADPDANHSVEEGGLGPNEDGEVDKDLLGERCGGYVALVSPQYEVPELHGPEGPGDDHLLLVRQPNCHLLLPDDEVCQAEGEVWHLLAQQPTGVAHDAPVLLQAGAVVQLLDQLQQRRPVP